MKKILFMLLASCFLAATGGAPQSIAAEGAKAQAPSADSDADRAEELIKSSDLFRQAAKNAVTESGVEEAKSYLKKSNDAYLSGIAAYGTGKYKESVEALSNSTHFALLAIVTVKKHPQTTQKQPASAAAQPQDPGSPKLRKKAAAEHDIGDVESFIGVLKRLLGEKDDAQGRKSLDDAIKAYESAIKNYKAAHYDRAIEDAESAYRVSTSAINTIMNSRAEVIIFPKQTLTGEDDSLEYELKKNDTFVYFAKLITADKNNKADKSLQDGEKQRNSALDAIKTGDKKKAIDLLRASTKNCIDAIKNNSTINR